MRVGSGDAADEIGLIFVQADYLANPPEGEQRCPSVLAAFAVGGVPLDQLGPSGWRLQLVGCAGLAPLVREFGRAVD